MAAHFTAQEDVRTVQSYEESRSPNGIYGMRGIRFLIFICIKMSEKIYNEMLSYAEWSYCKSFPYFSMFSLIQLHYFCNKNQLECGNQGEEEGAAHG